MEHFLILLSYDTRRKPVKHVFKVYSLWGLLIHAVSFYIDGLGFIEKEEFGAKEMAQRLGTFAALTEARIQFPAFMWWLRTVCNSNFRECSTSCSLCGQPHMTYTHTQTHIYINKNKEAFYLPITRVCPLEFSFPYE